MIVETEIKNPSLYGWPAGPAFWNNCKHIRYAEHEGYLYQHSGDYAGFPYQQRTDYPPNAYWGDSQRQDMWRASLTPNSGGRIEWELSQNYYHNYPWNGSSGRLTPEPQRGPFMPDAFGWVVDKRGDFWSGPWGSGYTGVTGDAAGLSPGYAAMFKWNMPGLHTNGIRLGDGWALPNQDRLGIDVPDAPRASGRTAESAYDPVTDSIYIVGHGFPDSSQAIVGIELRKFSCVPINGVHKWTALRLRVAISDLGAPQNFTNANPTWEHCNIAIAGRFIFYPFLCEYTVPAGTGNAGSARDRLRKTQIVKINIDTLAVTSLAMPSTMPWWARTWDGPEKEILASSESGQRRAMRGVRDQLVLGPDRYHKIGVDPWIISYDTNTNVWTQFDPPTDHDWPNTIGSIAAMPSLGEAWLVGSLSGLDQSDIDFRNAHGLHVPTKDSGRRIVKFKIV